MVALTGIERATLSFSSVQLGLSGCVFGPVQFAAKAFVAVRRADVLPWCCPAAGIRLIAGQSNTAGRLASIFLACVIQPHRSARGNEDADRLHISAVSESPALASFPRSHTSAPTCHHLETEFALNMPGKSLSLHACSTSWEEPIRLFARASLRQVTPNRF